MNKTKAERDFRMVWKDDIPVYAGVEPNLEWKEIPAEVTGKACFQVAKTVRFVDSRISVASP